MTTRMLMVVSGMDGTASASGEHRNRPPEGRAGFEETLRNFWATRPRRTRRGRKIAGVASGIGLRYGVDPILVRVAFAVATFYSGAGILLYLLGWLLLPQEGDSASAAEAVVGRGRSSTPVVLTVLLALALIPASGALRGGDIDTLVAIGLCAAALFLLHRHRGNRFGQTPVVQTPVDTSASAATSTAPTSTAPTSTAPTSAMDASAMDAAGSTTKHDSKATGARETGAEPVDSRPPSQSQPPAWDPLGVAPFAWDLPEPSKQPEPPPPVLPPQRLLPPQRRSRVTPVTIGLALVVGGLCALLAPYSGGWLTLGHALGLVLAVLGFGLVAGLFLGGGRGLIWLVIPIALAALLMKGSYPPHGMHVGNEQFRPVSVADIRSPYQLAVGELNLDLTQLSQPTGRPVTANVQVDVGVGKVLVRVPRNVHVEAHCSAGVGSLNCLNRQANGPGATAQATVDASAGGTGGNIVLDVHVGSGTVEVTRG